MRRPWSVRRSARHMCVGHSRCSSTEIDALARRRNLIGQLSPYRRACVRTDYALVSTKHHTSDSSPKSTTATPEYGLHLRSHRPNRCRHPPDTEEGHAGHNSSQNTRTIISLTIHVLPERGANVEPSRKVGQNRQVQQLDSAVAHTDANRRNLNWVHRSRFSS